MRTSPNVKEPMTNSTLTHAASLEPNGVLMDLLKTHSDHHGWFEDSLVCACADELQTSDIEGALRLSAVALNDLLTDGVVIATSIHSHPLSGRMVTLA